MNVVARIQDFIRLESFAGILLMAAAAAAFACEALIPDAYETLFSTRVAISVGDFSIAKPLVLWINDGLMAIFFFLVGLEIKRELLQGELSTFKKASLPLFAAVGGMAAPAIIFVLINSGDAQALRGWAIPAATDIAFALGVLALLGARAPANLKTLLLAIAIIDDLGAIIIIALFYTSDLSVTALGLGAVGITALAALNRLGVKQVTPYALVGVFIWVCVLKSGVHATLAGVITALAVPIEGRNGEQSPLHRAEHDLHPWVAYLVLPAFAFANAGVSLDGGFSIGDPVPLGAALGLFLGKPIGVLLLSYIAARSGLGSLPEGVSWRHMVGLAALAGIGFTMSIFIASLAYANAGALNGAKTGILLGSFASAATGLVLLGLAGGRRVDQNLLDKEQRRRASSAPYGS